MNPYQNQYMITGSGQGQDGNRIVGQNLMQLQCQPSYFIQPQQVPYMQLQYPVNPVTSRMPYQPYFMYTQLPNFPSYQNYTINQIQQPFSNIPNANQLVLQVTSNDQCYNPIITSVGETNFKQIPTSQNSICSNAIIKDQSLNSIRQDKILNKSENTISINQVVDQKKRMDYDFLSSSSSSIAKQQTINRNEQNNNITQKSPLNLPAQQMRKQTSDIATKSPLSPKILLVKNQKADNMSDDTSQSEKIEVNKQGIHYNKNGSLIFNLSPKEITFLKQLSVINIQNAFKNILKGFTQYVNNHFDHIYIYDYNSGQSQSENQEQNGIDEQKNPSGVDLMSVKKIECPTQQQKKTFIQKFNKFIKNKKYNNTSIKQIIENKLYSTVLKDYIVNNSADWIQQSNFQNKEDIVVVLQFFRMCCDNSNLLLFLSKTNDKLLPFSS